MQENKNSQKLFFGGLVAGIAAVCTIGFFVLLFVMISGRQEEATPVAARPAEPVPAARPSAPPAPAPSAKLALSEDDWYKGNKDAPVTIVEFSDLECPFCKRFHGTMQQVIDDYGSQVKWVYRHFPLETLHSKAAKEAEATECAGELGGNEGFWAYTDRLIEITPANNGLDLALLPQIAQDAGLDRAAFEDCLDSGRHEAKVREHARQAAAAGGRGTPHSVIVAGNTQIPLSGAQPYEAVVAAIQPYLGR